METVSSLYVESVPTEKGMAQRIDKKQKKRECLKKKKLTNKEITEALIGFNHNYQIIWKEMLEIKQIFSLYLECIGHTDKFDKFVKGKVKEFEKQQRSEIKK